MVVGKAVLDLHGEADFRATSTRANNRHHLYISSADKRFTC